MGKNKRRTDCLHDNSIDIDRVNFSLNDTPIKIDQRLLNKINRKR